MKVKQKMSLRFSSNELCTPPGTIKPKSNALDTTLSPAPIRFSSIRLNYVSPLGNHAGSKKTKKHKWQSKQKEVCEPSVRLLSESSTGSPSMSTRSRKRSRRRKSHSIESHSIEWVFAEKLDVANTTEVVVIPDTPTQCDTLEPPSTAKTDEPQLDGTDRLEDSAITETPDKNEVPNSKKRKKKSCSRNRFAAEAANSELANATSIIADPPSNGKPVGSDSTDNDGVDIKDKSKKRKRREKSPSDCDVAELPSFLGIMASPPKKKQKQALFDGDISEIPPCFDIMASPPIQKQKVQLANANNSATNFSVTINNGRNESDIEVDTIVQNVTIDLEAEDDDVVVGDEARNPSVALNDTVTVLSDDEDTDDIIVLGSPVVPSVGSYRAISTKNARPRKPPKHPVADLPRNIIARAITELSKTAGGHQMLTNANASPEYCNITLPSTSASSPTIPPSPANVYGGNLYNAGEKVEKKGLRPVIIDGSNVAMGHGNGKIFSCRGIEICVNYFLKRKHKVFAFLPKFRRHNTYTKDAYLLDKLQADKNLIFTPSRFVDGQSDVPYDDRYIVQTAAELGGVIVSTDNYRDLLRENPHWHDTIKNRLLMFTWVEDLLIFPQDPLGRRGCGLEEFLRF